MKNCFFDCCFVLRHLKLITPPVFPSAWGVPFVKPEVPEDELPCTAFSKAASDPLKLGSAEDRRAPSSSCPMCI